MFYAVNKRDGYIRAVVKGVVEKHSNITEEEYIRIKEMLENPPASPDEKHYYRLRDNLEWVLCEIPERKVREVKDENTDI